jgi:hypothetical protein
MAHPGPSSLFEVVQTATHDDFEVVERVVDGHTFLLASGECASHRRGHARNEAPYKPAQYFGKEAPPLHSAWWKESGSG